MDPTSGTSPGTLPTGGSGINTTIGIGLVVLASLGALVLFAATRRRRAAAFQPASAEWTDEALLEMPAKPVRSFIPRAAPTGEEHVPRWRRPSVTAARFETDASVAVHAASAAAIPPARTRYVFSERIDDLVERMVVRYDNVALLDRPDEALGRTQEVLDQGDEVGVLEHGELWANVTTPTGLAGWIPALALAALPPAASDENPAPPAGIAPEPAPEPDDELALDTLLETIAAARLEAIAAARLEAIAAARQNRQEPASDAESEPEGDGDLAGRRDLD